ncbi:hypothetical protein SELMODRAFT_415436 [Selaginella moellendorffii]|uniref:Uncharacterized protein n=1 Tax=Selaginella moellendorffii TaxID=88036 RepID=D8RW43_SELML|nr:hypothetical protein SELMODRAFT_415436 [Selaginella moellendorffii]
MGPIKLDLGLLVLYLHQQEEEAVPMEGEVVMEWEEGVGWLGNEAPKSLEQLLDVFYKSSARNCLLLLNVPPNSSGLIDESDFQTLEWFSSAIDSIFSINLAVNPLSMTASSVRSSLFGPKQILDKCMETFWAPM